MSAFSIALPGSFILDSSHPVVLFALYAVVYLAVLVFVYRGARSAQSARARNILTVLRVIAVLLVLFLLLNPSIIQRKPYSATEQIAVMFDTSKSMTIRDEEGERSRFDRMAEVVGEADLIQKLGEVLPVREFRFDSEPASVDGIGEAAPDGDTTHLLASLAKSASGSGEKKTKAVVLMTDGADTSDGNFLETIRDLNRQDVAVYPVGFGSDEPRRDIAISKVKVSKKVARNTEATIDVFFEQVGFEGTMLPVKLMKGEEVVESSGVLLEGESSKATLTFTPKVEGTHQLRVVAEIQDGEAFTENNEEVFSVNAIKSKLRILYMEGTMYRVRERELWEYQYLEQAVMESPDMEIKTLFRDQSNEAYMAGVSWVRDPVNGFPTTKRELFKYDIIIASDVDLIYFTDEQLDWIVEFVHDYGGGFIMIGGWTSFGSGGYDESVVDKMLPVDMQGRADGYFEGASFKMVVTPEGKKHPIFQISEKNNDEILDSIPYFRGCNRVQRAKPAAVTIAEHPYYKTAFGSMPLIAVQQYGNGRSMAFVSDTTAGWGELFESDWGEDGDNRYYRRFWQNTFRWLGQYRLSRPSRFVLLETEKASYGLDEEIPLTVEVKDENYNPTSEAKVKVRITDPDGERTEITLMADFKKAGRYTGSFEPEKVGRYEAEVFAYLSGAQLDTDFMQIDVAKPNVEFKNYVKNTSLLRRLAQFTGGRVVDPDEAMYLPQIIRENQGLAAKSLTETVPMWDKWPFLLILFILFTTEWVFRKRVGLA